MVIGRSLTLSALLLLGLNVRAPAAKGFDLGLGAAARTSPWGASASATGGYGLPFWGDPDGASPWYGYARPSLELDGPGAPIVALGFDLAPVSFWELSGRRVFGNVMSDSPGLDCASVECKGGYQYTSFGTKLSGRYRRLFNVVQYERRFYGARAAAAPSWAEPEDVLALSKGADRTNRFSEAMGFDLSRGWSVGASARIAYADVSRQSVDSELAFVRDARGDLAVTVGFGRIRSDLDGVGPEAVVSVQWQVLPKIGF